MMQGRIISRVDEFLVTIVVLEKRGSDNTNEVEKKGNVDTSNIREYWTNRKEGKNRPIRK